jgi:uncharacterized protein
VTLAPGPCAVRVEHGLRVPMRDGVHLASDVYRPVAAGPWPSLLERTPYNRAGTNHADVTAARPLPLSKPEIAQWFASHGFAVLLQDCRGRYDSEGEFHKYVHEAEDGQDTLDWLTRQAWCNGRIGTLGLSYCAHVQAAIGCLAPAALASQFLDSGGFSSAYHSGIRQGGAFELKQATWAWKHALLSPETQRDPARRAALEAQDIRDWFARMPWWRGHSPVSAAPEYEDYLFEQWERGEFDDYWRQLGLYTAGHYADYADVPMVHMSSWFDPYARTAVDNFTGLAARKRGPVHLILGPWTHGRRSETHAGDVDFGARATFEAAFGMDFFELRRRWFDYSLRHSGPNPLARGRVAVFVMGGGSGRRNAAGRLDHGGDWLISDTWPLPGTGLRPLYLHAGQRLDFAPPTVAQAQASFDYDPRHPVPTIGGTLASGEPIMRPGAFDQRDDARFFGCSGTGLDLGQRPDVLSFATAPLAEELVVAGPVVARLWVSSDAPDTDITVKLIDWHPPSDDYPQGFAMNLTEGILRLRYRNSWECAELLQPGRVYEVAIEPFPTANRFLRGHRLRLDVSSSNFPHFDLNPNSGEPEGAWRQPRIARNTVYFDRAHPSQLLLPVLPGAR